MKKYLLFLFPSLIVLFFAIIMAGCSQNNPSPQASPTASPTPTPTQSTSYIIRLFLTYPSNPSAKGKTYDSQNFGSAYSIDGINFTQEAGARLGPLANLSDPDVIKESSSKWVMFYSKAVSSITSEAQQLFKATSTTPNGAFSDDASFQNGYGNISSTIKIGSTFYVFGASTEGIAISTYNTTADALSYVKTAVSGFAVDPSVIQLSTNSFKMYYKVSDNTYQANSTDGLTWTDNALLLNNAEVPGAVYVNNTIYLYYIDSASSPTQGKILVKISSDNGLTWSSAQVVTGLQDAAADPDPVIYE